MKSTYDIEVGGADLIFLAFTGVLYIILVFIVEYFEDNG